jgi:hypothetical protein
MVANAVRPIEEELPVAESCLRVLVDRDDDCLNVLVPPPFSRGQMANLRERLDPRWVLVARIVVRAVKTGPNVSSWAMPRLLREGRMP